MVLGYKTGLKSVEEILEFFKTNESIYLEDIKVLKVEIQMKEIPIGELRKKLEIAQKEKDGSFMPSTLDLSYTGLDEFFNKSVVENCKANSSEEEPKGNPQIDLQNHRVIDSRCSRHMIGNMSYLRDYEEIDGGYVAFGGNPKGGKITRKGTIKTGNLDFENVYFLRELKFNLFSITQMCDKKNSVLFNDTECIVLSLKFKLIDESQVLLRVPRKNNMYSVDLRNIVPKGGLTRLFAKATYDKSKLWHRRLGHLNFKTMNKLAKGTLAEAFNTICYVQNRVLVVKPHNKTPYELVHGRAPTLSFMRPFRCLVTILNTIDRLGKFDGKAYKGFFVGYSLNTKAFRVFNSRTMIMEGNLHIRFSDSTPNVVDPKSSHDDGFKPSSEDGKKVDEDPCKENKCNDQEKEDNVNNTNNVNTVSLIVNATGTNEDNELPFDPNTPALEDVRTFNFSSDDEDDGAMADMNKLDTTIQVIPILTIRIHKDHPLDQVIGDLQTSIQIRKMSRIWRNMEVKTASTPMETQKRLLKDEYGEEVDVHMYRYQVSPKVSHLHDVKRIFRYLKGQPNLGLSYLKDSPFDFVAYTDSDYTGASLDKKSTIGDC
nr:ribonuclease H-like domain-containing protein [Tanacetum cinerariifolium]